MSFSLIVAAAGQGTRMGSRVPKPLIPIAGGVLIEKSTASLSKICSEAVIVVQRTAQQQFEDTFSQLNGLSVRYTYQETQRGTADAVHRGLRKAQNDWSIVVWADQGGAFFADSELLRAASQDPDIDLVVPVVWKDDPYAYFALGSKMEITEFCETRRGSPHVSQGWSDCGVFVMRTRRVRDMLTDLLNEDIADQNLLSLFPRLSGHGVGVKTLRLTDKRLTLGANTPEEVARVELEIIGEVGGTDGGR